MSNVFKCFIPDMLVDIICSNVSQGKEYMEPSSTFMNGVCLVVDISGFTKLSGEFCNMGKSGIDQLQLATNGYMGKLVEIIHNYGGHIMKFAGDAIICVFPCRVAQRSSFSRIERSMSNASDVSGSVSHTKSIQIPPELMTITPEVVLMATMCAHELRTIETEKLSVHVGISCGEMCFGVLGGFENHWECLVSGSCIQEISACLDDAAKKEVVLTHSCATILLVNHFARHLDADGAIEVEHRCADASCTSRLLPLQSGNHKVLSIACTHIKKASAAVTAAPSTSFKAFVDERAPAVMKLFVPPPIADKLEAQSELNYLAEIREVTTMFMKWESYDAQGKHRDLLKLQLQFYEVQKVLQITGAYLRQFLVDDKGCVLIACWGMPNLSYLDNANRALSAAAQIRCKLMAMDMACSFGITTGDVYCGTVGSALRMEYAAIGSVVNMSARLMCKAHGGILIDSATYERLSTQARESLTSLPPIKVKGRDEPLAVFSYTAGGTMKVHEKVVEDHAIPTAKRELMWDFLDTMLERDGSYTGPIAEPTKQSSKRGWWPFGGTKVEVGDDDVNARAPSASSITLQLLLIKGLEGSGKTTVVKWLRKHAQDRAIPVHCVRASPRDSQSDFMLWRRLFKSLVPQELFLSADAQRAYFVDMLRHIYPGISKTMRKLKFSVLRTALGVSSTFTRGEATTRFRNSRAWLKAPVLTESDKSVSATIVQEVVRDVIAHLLNDSTCLLVIENVENADEASLRVLVALLKLRTRSAIVLTALKEIGHDDNNLLHKFRSRAVRQGALHSTAWTKKYKCIIQCHRSTKVLFLEPFRATEVANMVAHVLGTDTAPAEVVQLVQDYSGGSCFWVLEILQYITEYGINSFMMAMEESPGGSFAHNTGLESLNSSPGAVDAHFIPRRRSSFGANSSFRTSRINSHSNIFPMSPGGTTSAQTQLDKLVLARFGNLSLDEQRVIRTASIVGMTFTRSVLVAVLPPQLQENLNESLQNLVTLKWIYPDLHDAQLFQFVHVHAHHLIYELTPPSERNVTHGDVARYIEEMSGADDSTQYTALCYHYQHCDTAKALYYATKALAVLLQVKTVFQFVDCLELLAGVATCCRSKADQQVVEALINQTQIAIVMFSMDYELQRKPRKQPWRLSGLCGGSSAVHVDAHDDHHHDHGHDHDHGHHHHEHEHVHEHDHEHGVCDPSPSGRRLCPCKQEEAQDAATERSISRNLSSSAEETEFQGLSKEERTKKVFLRQLQEIAAQVRAGGDGGVTRTSMTKGSPTQ